MFKLNKIKEKIIITSTIFLCMAASGGYAATATFDPGTGIVDMPVVEVLGAGSSAFYRAQLRLVGDGLELVSADPISAITGQRNVFDPDTSAVHVPSVVVGADDFYVKLKVVPGSNPLRFSVEQLANNAFQGCPSFATAGPGTGSCVLSGEITTNVTLTKNINWILSGGVYIGGDNKQSATITVNPGTKIFGQSGADYLFIRRGSKIMAEGTPDNPIVMTGPLQQSPGEWGGLLIAGNAPINGCNVGVALCEAPFEAITSEFFGGNNETDNSGILKYVQVLFAGFAVRPDEELNGLTLMGVGSGTVINYVQVHSGLDDGVEMFGGTVQMKHLVLTDNRDDAFDWTSGFKGRAQFVLIKQSPGIGDRGIEADNNEKNHDSLPRAHPVLSNFTIIGRNDTGATQGILLRRGTAANIWNTVITGSPECIRIDSASTYINAGSPGSLTGELTIRNSIAQCDNNFADGDGATFSVSDWFLSQPENKAENPLLSGYLPASGSPLTLGGAAVTDPFFDTVDFIGAFKDASDDWTKEWTFPF
ncbi:hypothetical protein [Nitrosomonas sp.]|uniref:hypothetical protein n=1 Tax=Nitrosomonas sp. TaxID=42353 RepID=UPI001D293173|nr:hypothetical protein [Nitrosomonas sp.]MBX3617826.1 hypothetical protein [Nitrosomonas sp.]